MISPVIPVGMCWVCSALEARGHKVSVVDLMFSSEPERTVEAALASYEPDIVGISIRNIDNSNYTFLLDDINEHTVKVCKKHFLGPIIIGGSAVSISGPEMLHFFDLPYAIAGGGEASMAEFADRICKGAPLQGIPGLIIREDNRIIEENKPDFQNHFPALAVPIISKYIDIKAYENNYSYVQIQTKRGCALGCTYCTYSKIDGAGYRYRRIADIIDEIKYLHHEEGITTFEIIDNTFNIPLDFAKDFLKALSREALPVSFRSANINPGAIDEELLDLFIQNNFFDLGISVDSGSDLVLENMHKNFRAADVVKAAELFRRKLSFSPVNIYWNYLLGAPLESKETLAQTFELIKKTACSDENVFVIVGIRVYKGTQLTGDYEKKHTNRDNYFKPVLMEPELIELEEIKSIARLWSSELPNIIVMDGSEADG